YRAPAALGALAYRDDSYGDRLGWKEIVLRPGDGVAVGDADVPAESTSDELRAYPDGLLAAPLNRREAHARVRLAGPAASSEPALAPAEPGRRPAPLAVPGWLAAWLPALGPGRETLDALAG